MQKETIYKLTVFSTIARDVLIKNGQLVKIQEGGPAFYLMQTFKKENISTVAKTVGPIEVQILINKKGEFGEIPKIPKKVKIDFAKVKTPMSVVSTLLDEFDLYNLDKYKGKLFLDIQGYVRDGKDFGKKNEWQPNSEIMNNVFCLKGTEEEMSYLPKKILAIQKRKILLITKGSKGCKIFIKGKSFTIKPDKVIKSVDTIGAGDTFFAYCISDFIKTGMIKESARYATCKTAEFLQIKSY